MRYTLIWRTMAVLLMVALCFGCGPGNRKYKRESAIANTARIAKLSSVAQEPSYGRPTQAEMSDEDKAGSAGGGIDLMTLAATQPDRYLIKDAHVSIEVKDAHAAAEAITKLVVAAEGYVADLREQQDSLERQRITLRVRVRADRFDTMMQDLAPLGRVIEKQVTAQDVTEEYVDTDAKTRNLKKTEERLLEHLSRSAKLEDILKAEQEITRIREQIERLEGRLRFLSHRVAYSTIEILITERPKASAVVPPETFSTGKVASDAVRSLVQFAQGIWTRLIWVGVWAVVWLPPLVVIWFVLRRVRKAATKRD